MDHGTQAAIADRQGFGPLLGWLGVVEVQMLVLGGRCLPAGRACVSASRRRGGVARIHSLVNFNVSLDSSELWDWVQASRAATPGQLVPFAATHLLKCPCSLVGHKIVIQGPFMVLLGSRLFRGNSRRNGSFCTPTGGLQHLSPLPIPP